MMQKNIQKNDNIVIRPGNSYRRKMESKHVCNKTKNRRRNDWDSLSLSNE